MEASSLEQYQLQGVQETGKQLGIGSYAAVVEVDIFGTIFAGKKVHRVLTEQGIGTLVRRFEDECMLLSRLRHPHIVQFIGVYFDPESNIPVLVMEYLPTTLAQYIDRVGVPHDNVSYSILEDVALGLRYLHGQNPAIIHRDLSANNVLLTANLRAKISDLGVAKILNLTPYQLNSVRMTRAPGTPCYMPPEALVANPIYSATIDDFSYGILMVHVFCGRWPMTTREAVDPKTLQSLTEADRRREYLDNVGNGHPLMELILQCIDNNPDNRPKASEIHHRLKAVASRVLSNTKDLASVSASLVAPKTRILDIRISELEAQTEDLIATLAAKEEEILAREYRHETTLQAAVLQKDSEISLLRTSIERESNAKAREISAKDHVIASKEALVERYQSNIQALHEQLQGIMSLHASEPHPLNPHSELVWRDCASLPVAMTDSKCVLIDGNVYTLGVEMQAQRRLTTAFSNTIIFKTHGAPSLPAL